MEYKKKKFIYFLKFATNLNFLLFLTLIIFSRQETPKTLKQI